MSPSNEATDREFSAGEKLRGTADMSARRTGMAFQRTRLSADRTLMAVIRTSLALITFGFAIFQFFQKVVKPRVSAVTDLTVRHFGITLVALGMAMLTLGMIYHLQFMRGLRMERLGMIEEGLIHGETRYPVSMVLITAFLLWALGVITIVSMVISMTT